MGRPTLGRIGDVTCPVAVLAGSADSLVPVEQSREVSENAGNLFRYTEIEGADHNDGVWYGPRMAEEVAALANSLGL